MCGDEIALKKMKCGGNDLTVGVGVGFCLKVYIMQGRAWCWVFEFSTLLIRLFDLCNVAGIGFRASGNVR